MTLFLSLLPLYLLGNLHCLGMCGPLVMLLGKNRYRFFYLLGRILAFTLAGLVSAEMGLFLTSILEHYRIPSLMSFLVGGMIIALGILHLLHFQMPWFGKILGIVNQKLSILITKDSGLPLFVFGFSSLFLPCGQTLIVFSACALSGSPLVGLLNGLLFALITSPALFFAMKASHLLKLLRESYAFLFGVATLLVGGLALCRGFADLNWISHCVLVPKYHIVLY